MSLEKNGLNDMFVQRCKIVGKKTVLVPYRRLHVPKYHEWMKNPTIRELTASEPLTLEEEYAMQKTWVIDENKCTFIVLHKNKFDETGNEVESMVGDVNLFLCQLEDEEDSISRIGELEVMIAEEGCRGKGLGYEAALAMLSFGIQFLKLKKFCVKIGYDNVPSKNLFEKLLFTEVSRSDIFREVTFELNMTQEVELHLHRCFYLSCLRTEWYWSLNGDDDKDLDTTIAEY